MLNDLVNPAIIEREVKSKTQQFVHKVNRSNEIIAYNKKMKELIKFVNQVANLNSNVLILGETGTGKDLFARKIYEVSSKRQAFFKSIYCVSVPEEIMVSQLLFSINRSEGTIFLNEIAEFSPEFQLKLISLLKKANVRIIASSNKKLYEMVKEGSFREDLYNLLNGVQIYIPPLRERYEDIKPLIYHLLSKFNKKYDVRRHITQECIEILSRHSWPGNVRELENVIENLVVRVQDNLIKQCYLSRMFF